MSRHGAIVKIDVGHFLKMLDFEGGEIHSIKLNDSYLPQDEIVILLEHPDLPEIIPSQRVDEITPIYQRTYGDNGCILRVDRTDPPKLKDK